MTTKVQINTGAVFSDYIDAYSNGEKVDQETLNRPLVQLGLNTGWLKAVVDTLTASKEDKIAKKSAFNRDFGTTSGTVAQGDDPRFTDARTPLSHNHNLLDLQLQYSGEGFLFYAGNQLQIINAVPSVDWEAITGIPTHFRSSVDMLDGFTEAMAQKSSVGHTHNISDVKDLRNELDYLLNDTSVPAHTHDIDDIIGLNRTVSILIQRQTFNSTGESNFFLEKIGSVFKVTINGIDIEETYWSQQGQNVAIDTVAGDVVTFYSEGSALNVSPVTRDTFKVNQGATDFEIEVGVQVWQVTVNGVDLETFRQTANIVTLDPLLADDIVIIYGMRK